MDEAAIKAFVDGLHDPADFTGPDTAVAGRTAELLAAGGEGVEPWRAVALTALVDHVVGVAEPPVAVALIQAAGTVRVFEQGGCEELGWLVDRVNHEVCAAPKPWVAIVAPDPQRGPRDLVRYSALKQTPDEPITRLCWYAETRSPQAASAVTGDVDLTGGEPRISAAQPVRPSDAGVLARVLRGHPDRRRHRLPTSNR